MKKILTFILLIVFTLSLVGCGNSASDPVDSSIVADTNVFRMQFSALPDYTAVERYSEFSSDGTLIEKDITYDFEDETFITFAGMTNQLLNEILDVSTLEAIDANGQTFYRYDYGDSKMAFAQVGTTLYGIQYDLTDGGTEKQFVEIVKAVKFGDSEATVTDTPETAALNCPVEEIGNIYGYSVRKIEDPNKNIIKVNNVWKFGKSDLEQDFRIVLTIYKNSKLDDVLSANKTYIDETIGDLTFKVLQTDEPAYDYYIQYGDDVYQIRNGGSSNGWFTNRSDTSNEAFKKLLTLISFK